MPKRKCPICGKEREVKVLREWEFRNYEVTRFECLHCKTKFNYYLIDGNLKYSIPSMSDTK